jgi:hypothetical protein
VRDQPTGSRRYGLGLASSRSANVCQAGERCEVKHRQVAALTRRRRTPGPGEGSRCSPLCVRSDSSDSEGLPGIERLEKKTCYTQPVGLEIASVEDLGARARDTTHGLATGTMGTPLVGPSPTAVPTRNRAADSAPFSSLVGLTGRAAQQFCWNLLNEALRLPGQPVTRSVATLVVREIEPGLVGTTRPFRLDQCPSCERGAVW